MKNILDVLNTGYSLLKSVNEQFWSKKIERVLNASTNSTEDSIDYEQILSWFGGMGSLNDLIISSYNGHLIGVDDEERVNAELKSFRTQLYEIARRYD